mgnify:CR=1 FL=1
MKPNLQKQIIRSSMISLKYSNKEKRENIIKFIDEYKRVTSIFIDIFWEMTKIPLYVNSEITRQVKETWLSGTALQASAKQAKGIVSGTRKKKSQMIWKINDMKSKGEFKKARKLQAHFDKKQISKPNLNNIQPELDSRFCSISFEQSKTSFDGWIEIGKLKKNSYGEYIQIPVKRHKHLNKMLANYSLKTVISLSKKNIILMFEIPDIPKKVDGSVIGVDIGVLTTLSFSDNQVINTGNHGWTYDMICEKLSRQTKESKNFNKTVKHRSNYIHEMVNRVDLTGVKQINRENIQISRKGRNFSRKLSHFNYAEIFEVLDNYLFLKGVLLKKVSPTYTSQRCSACGWVLKANRNGKKFKCKSCSFELDADLNASRNISLYLSPIGKKERLKQKNRKGFYWAVLSEDFIVPHAQKDDSSCATESVIELSTIRGV